MVFLLPYQFWEGMFWYWEITKDNEVKRFYLQQAEWRCDLKKVARPFKAAFSASNWVIGWVHSMYFIKIAFDKKIIRDEDISM